MNFIKRGLQKVKSFWIKAVDTAKKVWPMAFVALAVWVGLTQGLDIPVTWAFDGSSIVTPDQVTGLNKEASDGWMTLIATVISLSSLLLTMFFGKKILWFLRGIFSTGR